MSIMVTGGTGFIGNRIIRKLLDRGEDVVCFDLAPPRANLGPYLDRIKMYRGDVTQLPHLLEAINTHEVHKIIHMAALLPPDTETSTTGLRRGMASTLVPNFSRSE